MIVEWLDNARVAWDGIVANKLRSGLTMLGVVIGVATVIALLAIGAGVQSSIEGRISKAGTNLLLVRAGAVNSRGGVQGAGGGAVTLTIADADAIADVSEVPDVVHVAPEFRQNAQLIAGDTNINAQVRGVTATFLDAYALEVDRGRFVDDADVRERGNIVILGSTAATNLFGDTDPLGQRVKAKMPGQGGGLVPLTVVGVLAALGGSALTGDTDAAVFIPLSTAQFEVFGGRNRLGQPVASLVTVVAAEGRSADASAQITALLRRRHGLADDQSADFNVTSQADLLTLATDVTQTMKLFLGAIAAISLVVGGIGIMNIMLVSVTERTREIGIRKAVGARRADILAQFLLEAVVLSVLGGLLGVGLGFGVAEGVDRSGLMTTSVTLGSVVMAVAFALVVGLLSGIYPARRAAAMNPIDALRYE